MQNASATSPAYTAGPWVVDTQSPYSKISVKQKYGVFVCDLECGEEITPEVEANARLIAKAPDLAEQLQGLIAMARSVVGNWENGNLAEAVSNLQRVADEAEEVLNEADCAG
jgi:hypothetical protein